MNIHKQPETRTSDKLRLPRAYTNRGWEMWDGDNEKNRNGRAHIQHQEDSALIWEPIHNNKNEIFKMLHLFCTTVPSRNLTSKSERMINADLQQSWSYIMENGKNELNAQELEQLQEQSKTSRRNKNKENKLILPHQKMI